MAPTLFLLVACLTLPNGEAHDFVLDSQLSAEDCVAAVAGGVSAVELQDGSLLDMSRAELTCEAE